MDYKDGDVVNGHRYDAASNSWVPVVAESTPQPPPPPATPESSTLPPPVVPPVIAETSPVAKKGLSKGAKIGIGAGVGVLALIVIAAAASNAGSSGNNAASGSSSSTPSAASSTPEATPTSETPTPEETTPVATNNVLTKKNVTLTLKIKSKECFGSAGCNIVYQVKTATTAETPLDNTYDVTFTIKGGEDGPIIGTLTVDPDGNINSSDIENVVSVPSSKTKLTIAVTDVEAQ